jgi:hypothetical protein
MALHRCIHIRTKQLARREIKPQQAVRGRATAVGPLLLLLLLAGYFRSISFLKNKKGLVFALLSSFLFGSSLSVGTFYFFFLV